MNQTTPSAGKAIARPEAGVPGASLNAPANLWPAAITGIFIVFFAGLVAFIAFASTQPMDLVRPDYYEEEIRYQEQLDRVNRTRQVGQPVQVSYDKLERRIRLQLPAGHAGQAAGQIHLYRPSDARLDQRVPLSINTQGIQTLDARNLPAGLWKVQVHWTRAGEEYYFDQAIVVSAAGA